MAPREGFSDEWERTYQSGAHASIWPWSDVVSLVMRHARPRGAATRVLELGVGAGANVAFFQAQGVDYHAIDGSPTTIARLRERFPLIADRFVAADFTRAFPSPGDFDIIVDRSSLTHNSEAAIRSCIGLIEQRLKPGGIYIGVDWFSTEHSSFKLGIVAEDRHTRTGIERGHLAGVGRVHFSDRQHLSELFGHFELVALVHKRDEQMVPAGGESLAWLDIVCRKPAAAPAATS